MFYVVETPVHFAIVLSICIITCLIMLLSIFSVNRGSSEQRLTRIFGFLFVLCIFLMYVVFASSIALLPANASIFELFPFYQIIWGFAGLHGFFLILYCLGARFLSDRKLVLILIVLGGIVYVALLFLLPNIATAVVVSDGWLNYVAMPLALVGYAASLGIIYMVLVPLFVSLRLTRKAERTKKYWIWIGWIGLLLSLTASILISAVQFTALFMLYCFGLVVIAWLFIGVSAVLIGLLSKPSTQ